MRVWLGVGLWAFCGLGSLGGCLIPKEPTECARDGTCHADLDAAPDLLSALDLGTPDLKPLPDLMPPPDLKPMCLMQSDCQGGLACVANICQLCTRHSQCNESLVCDVYLPSPGLGAGRCVAPGVVIHVDNNAGVVCAGADGTRAKPFCTLPAALAVVDATKKSVRIAASPTDYGNLAAANLTNRTVTIYGPAGGDDGTKAATIGKGVAVDAIVLDANTNLTVDGMELRDGTMGALFASLATSSITVRRSRISGFGKVAVRVSNAMVSLDRTLVTGNAAGAFTLGTNTRYTVTNSFIVDNRIPDNGSAIVINASATGTFRYNTVVGNTNAAPSGLEAAIDCPTGAAQIEDSIFLTNTPFALAMGSTQFKGGCVAKNTVVGAADKVANGIPLTPDFEGQTDFRLRDTAASAACCVNKGQNANPADFFGTPRQTPPDIGAHELK